MILKIFINSNVINYSMQNVNICFKKLKVSRLSIKDSQADITIRFEAGSEKEITRMFDINKSAEEQAGQVFAEARNLVRNIHTKFDQGDLVEGIITISFENEDYAKDKIELFLAQVFDKIRLIKHSKDAEGYINKINNVNNMMLDLGKQAK